MEGRVCRGRFKYPVRHGEQSEKKKSKRIHGSPGKEHESRRLQYSYDEQKTAEELGEAGAKRKGAGTTKKNSTWGAKRRSRKDSPAQTAKKGGGKYKEGG